MIHRPSGRLLTTSLSLAAAALALLIVLRPFDAAYRAYLHQGDLHADSGERAAAVAAYEQATAVRPDAPEPYLRLARLYLEWGRVAEAQDALVRADSLGARSGDDERLTRYWIAVRAAEGDWPAVVERAHHLLNLVPNDRDARRRLARAYMELRAWDAAQTELALLLETDPADTWAHTRLGALMYGFDGAALSHLAAANTPLAEKLLVAAESPEAAEDVAYASALFGQVLFEEEEWALASRQFERALSYSPGYADAHAYLGYALDQLGDVDEARPHLLTAVDLAPESVVAKLFLGLYYEGQGDTKAARIEYEAAYDIDPDNPATCAAIARTWIAEGRLDTAEIWLVHAVTLAPDEPVLWEILARFYLEHNIVSEQRGIEAASRLAELEPNDARAHDLRGWAALQTGDLEAAEESLLRALSLDPDMASAHYHLGLLWQLRGDSAQAQESFRRALDLDTTGQLEPLVERALLTAQ